MSCVSVVVGPFSPALSRKRDYLWPRRRNGSGCAGCISDRLHVDPTYEKEMRAGMTEGFHLTGGYPGVAARASWVGGEDRRCVTRPSAFRATLHVSEVVIVLVPLS
jgi:hypothetical protein